MNANPFVLIIGGVAIAWNIVCLLGIRQSQRNFLNIAGDLLWFGILVIGNLILFAGLVGVTG